MCVCIYIYIYIYIYILPCSFWIKLLCFIFYFFRQVFLKNIYLFNLFIFDCIGSLLLCVGFLQLQRVGVTLCCGAWASHCSGFSCGGARALGTQAQQLWLTGSRAQAQQLWCMGLVVPRHVGSSWKRDRTHVPCIGRWILNHCATREVPVAVLLFLLLLLLF